jgi:hypothetical protein
MKPNLVLLTNPGNSEPQEDIFLGKFLHPNFDVILSDPFMAADHINTADIVLIRNIWPTKDHITKYTDLYKKLVETRAIVYNSPDGAGDMKGKTYLPELYRQKYPVIPSVSTLEEISELGFPNFYFIKPIYGGSSEGVQKLSLEELQATQLDGYIIQPFVAIKHEVSFYYIDGVLQHALYNPESTKRWELAPFHPSQEQEDIARTFVNWNTLSFGIQRIDCCITEDNQFLLIEIEDWCPYLSLLEIKPEIRNHFLKNLVISLEKTLARS